MRFIDKDIHDTTLINNVHPPEWCNPEPAKSYNLVVIGAGTAGLVTAAGAAGLGARVALVEKSLMGGDCLNFGCVPSKALIRSAKDISRTIHPYPTQADAMRQIGDSYNKTRLTPFIKKVFQKWLEFRR